MIRSVKCLNDRRFNWSWCWPSTRWSISEQSQMGDRTVQCVFSILNVHYDRGTWSSGAFCVNRLHVITGYKFPMKSIPFQLIGNHSSILSICYKITSSFFTDKDFRSRKELLTVGRWDWCAWGWSVHSHGGTRTALRLAVHSFYCFFFSCLFLLLTRARQWSSSRRTLYLSILSLILSR